MLKITNDDGKQFMAVLWRSFNVVISSLNYQLLIVPQIKRKDHDFGDVCSCVKLGLKLFWSRTWCFMDLQILQYSISEYFLTFLSRSYFEILYKCYFEMKGLILTFIHCNNWFD